MVPPSSRSGRAVAITGAGSGLGRDIALGFAAKGYIVFGTAMSAAEVQDLKDASRGRVSLTVCNITMVDALQAWAGGVSDALGNAGIDILINNAAVYTPGPIEILPLDAIRKEFEVNVFSALSVINAFLPTLRRAHGRIVHIGTCTATDSLPFNGPSDASRAAMDVFSAAYRAELKPFGIDVVVAPVGNMTFEGQASAAAALKRVAGAMTQEQRKLYGKTLGAFAIKLDSLQTTDSASAMVAARVIELAEQYPVPVFSTIGPDGKENLPAGREDSDTELDTLQ